ncbi:MAG: restriction endonuclease subunit S [Sphingobacteriales bacterium]|nr:MAG: restriction endonuclease subunit S [Sphingobacteriales bacterium]
MSWRRARIGTFLKRVKQPVEIENSVEYKRITIKTKHQGIFLRDKTKGSLIGTKLQFIVFEGQFLLSKIDARLGAFGIVPKALDGGIITGNFWAFDVDESQVNINWFNLFTSSGNFYDICNQASSGTTHRKYLDEQKFLDFEINLPDLNEQNVFMNKYENFYASYQLIQNEIAQQQIYLQHLRQTILQEAVEGKLTKQDPTDEPATELLKRIKAEKESLIKAGKLKKEKELLAIKEEEILFELPKRWIWCRLGEICTKIGSGSTPRGGKEVYKNEGVKFIRSQNVYNESLIFNNVAYIDVATHEKMDGTKVVANDILLNITGGSIGRCALVPQDFDEANVSQHVTIVRTVSLVVKEFIHQLMLSPYFQEYIMATQTGGNREGLAKKNMELMLIPLPPLAEQLRIVAKVQGLRQHLSQLESHLEQSRQYAQALLQSVLRETFTVSGKVYEVNGELSLVAEK